MQNKGFVKVFAILLTLVCVFYLSFSFVTRYHMKKAAEDPKGETHYLDSVQNEKVWLGSYTLKQCREMEIGLGLRPERWYERYSGSFCTGCCKSFG